MRYRCIAATQPTVQPQAPDSFSWGNCHRLEIYKRKPQPCAIRWRKRPHANARTGRISRSLALGIGCGRSKSILPYLSVRLLQ